MTTPSASAPPAPPCWTSTLPDEPSTGLALDLWRWDLDDPRPDGDRVAVRRAARDRTVRRILARYLCCSPADIVFGRSARGRPFVVSPQTPIDFNLSDSRSTVVLAVTREARVGVDIEYHRDIRDPLAIATRVLPAPWIDELKAAAEHERPAAFFSLWTRFEACQKARGQGIFAPRTAQPAACFGAFVAAPACSGHVCMAGPQSTPAREQWRYFDGGGGD